MDHDEWYAYVYPKSLGAHEVPKLGVPRLCARLRASADPHGGVYLDNVDVNGVLLEESGLSLWKLLVLLNSRLLDWIFRRFSVPFRGEFFSANKQSIAPLPIQVPEGEQGTEFERLGQRLHDQAARISAERQGFLEWLEGTLGRRVDELGGATRIRLYNEHTLEELLSALGRNRNRLARDVTSRSFREDLEREFIASTDRLATLSRDLAADEATADAAVYDLYGLLEAHRELVDQEYPA